MEIILKNLQKKIPIRPQEIIPPIRKILRSAGFRKVRLSLVFVADARMRALNKKHLGHDYVTDVLTFAYAPADVRKKFKKFSKTLDAEIILAPARVRTNAKVWGVPLKRELVLCLIHGILHCLGYDDHTPHHLKQMRNKERQWLAWIKNL